MPAEQGHVLLATLWLLCVCPPVRGGRTAISRTLQPIHRRRGDRVAIGVLMAKMNADGIGRAALQTWVREARANGILVLFFGAFEDSVS